ncbi:DUF6965 family protein [Algoriphagus sediminis]|uniref:DUF6371 domain-containing protein n=1 Tax=Algoriphagus sediminis TaxID=3057113 RepID=A0ABT7YGK6_9BACT|nr:DUF6371 domain-containing protein [Algoriphagus sediminis]MDN3205659.1 DUF6371 domain-containing protein [Algoriphagus sediminis]
MNTEHPYILERGSRKYHCPGCKKRRFVRYVDTQTGNYLPEYFGRCDRESKCGYFLNPYQEGYTSMDWAHHGKKPFHESLSAKEVKKVKKVKSLKKTFFYPVETLNLTRSGYERNTFIQNLLQNIPFPFELEDVEKVISLYHLGTIQNGYRRGAITFPFIDSHCNVRTIQVKQFDKQNHTTSTDFLHSIIEKYYSRKNQQLPKWLEDYSNNETKVSCLFGEHLLSKYPYNPIALVEAPKTAIYGALYFGLPEHSLELLWLAVYNLSSLNFEKCKALKGRNVYLFPDLSKASVAYDLWVRKSNEIQMLLPETSMYVSDLLERLATNQDKSEGKDLADYLVKHDWRIFRKQKLKKVTDLEPETNETSICDKSDKSEVIKNTSIPSLLALIEKPEDWGEDIAELENFFKSFNQALSPTKLNKATIIQDYSRFIDGHLSIVKVNNGKRTFKPYLDRLLQLKMIIESDRSFQLERGIINS